MIWSLFVTFIKLGFISFGGGYAMLPVIKHEVMEHAWMTEAQFTNTIAIAGMGPGPIATNSATLIGYHVAGVPGAIISTAGIVLPSLLVIVVLAAFFHRIHHHFWVRSAFYGLMPIVAALIVYAAINFVASTAQGQYLSWPILATVGLAAAGLIAIVKYRVSPLLIIIFSGMLGIILF